MVLSNSSQGDCPQLHVFNTECRITLEPIQTSFSLPALPNVPSYLLSEPCSHTPSQDELMAAPFYPDPSQQILAICGLFKCLVINIEQLLKHAQKWQGQCVELHGWGEIIELEIGDPCNYSGFQVSGCRLFYLVCDSIDHELPFLQVHDFSHGGCARNNEVSQGRREGRVSLSAHVCSHRLPWVTQQISGLDFTVGHDSIILCVVSVPIWSTI